MRVLAGVTTLLMVWMCAYWTRALINPERHRAAWARFYRILVLSSPMSPTRFARMAVTLNFMMGPMTVIALAGVVVADPAAPVGATGPVLLVGLVAFVFVAALGVLLLIVAASGRPRLLVLRPLRDLSEDEIDRWLTPPEPSAGMRSASGRDDAAR
ncbi:hypothetical protein [Cellulomonas soli]|uniref:Uncharacterized protein n=1 Tax=Cellulomonas soli TaxID=931535 RepID=A0A512PDV3_9CELL|nr:hypothetical protein [Cellulomonas soli]NYI59118.1 hypothetical protein [Cellulomonas soli]GEP69390.1 hypothetical protein CSO01_21050 [Cellulomonas soli]